MEIITGRLRLSTISINDLDAVHELHLLPETDAYNTLGIPPDIQTTESLLTDWIKSQNSLPVTAYVFRIQLIDEKHFIGLIALIPGKPHYSIAEVWYKIHVQHWHNGYATEALQAILEFGFNTLQLHRIEAGCATENIGSIKVLSKAGMSMEGKRRKLLPIRGTWYDNYMFGMLEEDFFNSTS